MFPCAELSKHHKNGERGDLTGILHTFSLSHTLSHPFHLCLSLPFAPYSPLYFSIFVFDSICSVCSAEVCSAERQIDKKVQTLQMQHWPEVPWKSLVPPKRKLFSSLITTELSSRETWCTLNWIKSQTNKHSLQSKPTCAYKRNPCTFLS